ncbi:EF hand family protein [Trichomonas vaginalis G3]|uniref:EF hand family protein n=1 Tax=Trichomonas vaginalis (strain ATCC PRA-98 / G3) TaxID=412133 RepID=A2FZT8_TRIV3|nr:calcium-binding protein family [Trichomonas vaginalis G3]EAX89579.1 EF hand family protein [Trichomonas vaginalis G3]KAI5496095.1 calcium-binding protein family [Trichomonas vaginalis G3]|eukprot:XP_001302509.1 EF hand family protein [Trichomonas vaginalis G3]
MALTPEEIKEYKSLFEEYDTNKNGTLEVSEISSILRKVKGHRPTKRQITNLMSKVDKNHDNVLSLDEFLEAMSQMALSKEKEAREVFNTIDTDKSGSITKEELLKFMEIVNQEVSLPDVDCIFDKYDVSQDDKINFSEFLKMYRELGF